MTALMLLKIEEPLTSSMKMKEFIQKDKRKSLMLTSKVSISIDSIEICLLTTRSKIV
jgi:hypothetical protein